jgi:hypothetical protein
MVLKPTANFRQILELPADEIKLRWINMILSRAYKQMREKEKDSQAWVRKTQRNNEA